jgi:hypothetical protein
MPEVASGKMLVAPFQCQLSASGRTLMHVDCKVLSKAKLFCGKDMFSPQSNSALIEPYRRRGRALGFC